ncbi:hypothetical protein [Streptomyces sp. NPDC002187]
MRTPTPRELEVLRQMAVSLFTTPETVKASVSWVSAKLGLRDRVRRR